MSASTAVTTARFSTRTRNLLTLVNLHWAAVGLLGLLNAWFLVQLVLAWQAAGAHGVEALNEQKIALTTAQLQARPLAGLNTKLATATMEADDFSTHRLPYAQSQIVTELGALAKRQNVKLARVQYPETPVLQGTSAALTEVHMDASLSGDYRPLVLFINSLERDRLFFVITGVSLSGQQSGTVGLRLRLTSYLRPPRSGEERQTAAAPEAPLSSADDTDAPAQAGSGGGGQP